MRLEASLTSLSGSLSMRVCLCLCVHACTARVCCFRVCDHHPKHNKHCLRQPEVSEQAPLTEHGNKR